jgi:mannose/fructose/N-acetylgalactosamine-specific phosphotransferase system component IID
MMFSNVVNFLDAIISLPPGAFIPLLMFLLFFWLLGKLFRTLILDGHWVILCTVALGCYSFAAQMVSEGNYVPSVIFFIPLLFIGAEAYKRLVSN